MNKNKVRTAGREREIEKKEERKQKGNEIEKREGRTTQIKKIGKGGCRKGMKS